MKKLFFTLISAFAGFFIVSCTPVSRTQERDTLYQVNLLQSLMQGYYEGSVTIKDLKANGDTGIGTFDSINGELIAVDGVVYQALFDGTIQTPADDTKIPYAAMSYFDSDEKFEVTDITDFNDLISKIDSHVQKQSANSFYLIKITGSFRTMYARSELKQEKPFKPLAEALKTDQREFHFENVSGTIIALYCPSYMGQLNSTGYHLHFISDDRTKGGHVFNLTADKLTVELDKTTGFKMVLSDDSDFNNINLAKDMTSDMNKVEKGK